MSKFYDTLKQLGVQGEATFEIIAKIFEEGLVKSYPKQKVIKFLVEYFIRTQKIKLFVDEHTDEQYFAVVVNKGNLINHIDEVNKKLEVYGWYVVKSHKSRLVIEPRNSDKSLHIKEGWSLYHITNKTYYNKIKKNGLNPRESTTTFNHPADRIYLLYTDDSRLIKEIADTLFYNKRGKLEDEDKNSNIWDEDQVVILEVDLPNNIEKFSDPMARGGEYFEAVYVKKSIHPNNIKLV
mgnify:CR=1 FL=1